MSMVSPLQVISNILCLIYNADQSIVDRAINDICILMQCSRHNLNVVGTLISALSNL